MSEAFNMEEYVVQIQSLAKEQLTSANTGADLVALMRQVAAEAEAALAANLEGSEHLACRAGCGTCCSVNVAVLFPEVVAIVDFVQTQIDPDQRPLLLRRLALLAERVAGLGEEERIVQQQSCAFLDESDNCSIYPVRPLICRSITSINAGHCAEALQAVAAGMERPIFMNLFQKSLMEETFIALAQGITQLGLDDHSEQLAVGVQQLLAQPQQVESFLARKPVWPDP